MPNWLKVVVVVVVLFVIALGARSWFRGARAEADARKEPARQAGIAFGETHDANECVNEAMEHLRQRDGIVDVSEHRYFLGACLEVAQQPAGFCDGVPSSDSLMASTDWVTKKCINVNFTRANKACGRLVQMIQHACHVTR